MDIIGIGKAVMGAVDTVADKFFMDFLLYRPRG